MWCALRGRDVRSVKRVQLTIIENSLLHIVYHLIDRAVKAICQNEQGCVILILCTRDMQLIIQVAGWHVVDTCNVGYRHPGTNGTHITGER